MKKKCTPVVLCAFLWALSYTASAQNNALSFDGTNYVAMTSEIVPDNFDDYTVEFWAYIPSYQAGQHYFISQGSFGTAFYIGYDGDDPTHPILAGDTWFTSGASGATGTTGVTMPVGKWTHIALVYNSGAFTGTLYINGMQASATTDNNFIITGGGSSLQLGAQYDNTQLVTGGMDELRIWHTQRTATQIRNGMYGAVDPTSANLLAYYMMNDNTSGVTVANNSTSTDSYNSGADGGWAGTASWAASPVQYSINALGFAGSAGNYAQVTIPGNSEYDLGSGGTIEMYVYPTSLTSSYSTLISNRGTTGTARYIFQVSNSSISLYDGTTRSSFAYTLPQNKWSHLAFVYNGSGTTSVYYNNVVAPIGTLSGAFSGTGSQPISLGITKDPTNGDSDPFQGGIDEVRIWTTQQLQSDISGNIYSSLTGSETGLVGLYTFNQGISAGDNRYLLTVPDNTANQNDASLSNFSLTTASASNFTSHTLVPLPINFMGFTAIATKDGSLLRWQTAQEENSKDFTIERSVDGASYSPIGSVDAAGNSTSVSNYSFVDVAPVNGKNYYRLKETDLDGQYTYSDIRIVSYAAESNQKLIWFQTGEKSVEVDLQSGNSEMYSVSDISGRTIQQGQLSSGKLYLTQLPRGLYVVKVITSSGGQLDTKVLVK